MESIMFNGIILTVNLVGQICGPVKKHENQNVSVDATPDKSKAKLIINTEICHTDRAQSPCTRKTIISGDVVKIWSRECPPWEKKFIWENLKSKQRIMSYLKRFDEGFGFSFEEL